MKKIITGVVLLVMSGFGHGALAAAEKVTICHKGGQTAAVPSQAVNAHLGHGDTLGECGATSPPEEETVAAVVMMRCDAILNGKVLVVSASSSPATDLGIAPRDDCAMVLAELLDTGYKLRSISSGSAEAGDDSLRLYTDYLLFGRMPVPSR